MTEPNRYTIINNPSRLINKYEVWFSGMADVQGADGYLLRKHITKPLKAFRTVERAKAEIKYIQDVAAFKGGAQ